MSNAEKRKQLIGERKKLLARVAEINESFPQELCCGARDCFEDAAWVQSTQFSGHFTFCDKHARRENDFGKENSSYFFWQSIADFLETSERLKKEEEKEAEKFFEK